MCVLPQDCTSLSTVERASVGAICVDPTEFVSDPESTWNELTGIASFLLKSSTERLPRVGAVGQWPYSVCDQQLTR